jgi:biofilm PGA synthesis N-glycosyltransferase PgaC
MSYYLLLVFVFYFVLLLFVLAGWRRVSSKALPASVRCRFISVVVAARNEEKNITQLLESLKQLDYPKDFFEVILVDDHSEDTTYSIAESFFQKNKIGVAIRLEQGVGKKAAIKSGIERSKGEIIVTTDGDCEVPIGWLKSINHFFEDEKMQMGVGAVKIRSGDFFSSLQSLEFASVMGTGAATLRMGLPTMCNGANLSFRKQAFQQVNGYEGNEMIASGDDQFLMEKINREFKDSVSFISSQQSIVLTQPVETLSDFFKQRIRWAGKWSRQSLFSRMLAIFIFLFQLSWLVALVFEFVYPSKIITALIAVKLFLEFVFLQSVQHFLSARFSMISFLALQFIYAPYVIIVALLSQWKKIEWKGR